MKGLVSMISTSVAISAAISRPAVSAERADFDDIRIENEGDFFFRNPSSDSNRNACRGSGVMFDSRRSDGIGSVMTSLSSFTATEFKSA